MKKDRTRIEEMILLFVLLSFLLRVAALLVVPYPSKPQMQTSFLVDLIGIVDRYLLPAHKGGERAGGRTDLWEGSLAQKIRDEVVLTKLAEMGLSEELKPPLPRVSLFPFGKLEEQEKKMILENSRFYHELGQIVHGKEREKEILDVPGAKTSDATGGTIPLPEDVEAQRIIAILREAAKEEETGKKSIEAAALDITGPAASRKLNYLPLPLQSKLAVDGDCLLKFWIFPDGTVGKIVPLVKGDTQAVVAAIDRIKRFRFAPLPKGVPQVEQWGVIPAKSVLR
ncbi:MAG: energy transducer TonB [Desulfobacterales bacterium]|nr:energy transducer TonB [Desulfobacterales bacterium]